MSLIVQVWQSGTYRFYWMIFFHWFILKPFFANVLDCFLFCGVQIDIKKILLTIWYHVIPVAAFIIYDFATINTVGNQVSSSIDNLEQTTFDSEYDNWKFYYTLIAVVPGAFSGALACVFSKLMTLRNEAWKIRRNESTEVQSFIAEKGTPGLSTDKTENQPSKIGHL